MMRRYSRKPPIQITGNPLSQQQGEPDTAYQMFQFWIAADGNRSNAEIALKFGKQVDTPRRYASHWRWHDRLELIKAARKEHPALVVPTEAPEKALEAPKAASPLDPITLRIESALDVAERAYSEASCLHKRLYSVAKTAADSLTANDIKSIAELRQIVQLTTELGKVKTDLSSHIAGIEELAKAVHKLRKRK